MEPSLNIAFTELQGNVGFHLGWGRDPEQWDANQSETVTQCIKGGMRLFYYCDIEWSFLKPMASLTLESGAATVKLPDDYQAASGMVYVSDGSSSHFPSLRFGPIGEVYRAQADYPDTTGIPQMLCEEPLKQTDGKRSMFKQLRIWPTADQAYTLQFQYSLNPQYLTGAMPYAYGGPQHAETLLAACRAYAEMHLDNMRDGVEFQEFMRKMQDSKDIDGRNKPQFLGYNRDLSDLRQRRYDNARLHGWGPTITFDGVTPGA